MSFKLIAIRPLPGTDSKYLKNLLPYRVYKLYNDYDFPFKDDDSTKEIIKVTALPSSVPEDLFNAGPLKINVSALVGKNGSGKSSLLELFFWAVNNLATNFVHNPESRKQMKTHGITADLEHVPGISAEFIFCSERLISSKTFPEGKYVMAYYKITVGPSVQKEDNYAVALQEDNGKFEHIPSKKFNLEDLFYTEVVNYSHYAYNSDELDNFINGLFHKNDSYQTPLVLNPMRTRGDFEISRENDLVRQRLLVNLLRPIKESGKVDFRKMGDNGWATELELELKEKKTYVEYGYDRTNGQPHVFELQTFFDLGIHDEIVLYIVRLYLRDPHFMLNQNVLHFDHVRNYLLYKIVSIANKYNEYNSYFKNYFRKLQLYTENKSEPDLEELREVREQLIKFPTRFLKELIRDQSHITFKLKQSLNYLIQDHLSYPIGEPINISYHSKALQSVLPKRPLIELMPPPIFKVTIFLCSEDGKKGRRSFEWLSSGEKQLIFSVSSILYHLVNLDSVSENKIQYRDINVVLEEIELYFHPAYQKKYVHYLLDSIGQIELVNVRAINLLLATHSPFILSDIPKQNILFLALNDDGFSEPQNYQRMKSFGANITDLLADSFFINDGLVGDHARDKINEVLHWLKLQANKLQQNNDGYFQLADIPNYEPKTREWYKQIIELIDEPLVKQKLRSMYLEFVPDDGAFKDEEIKRLEMMLKDLKNK